MEAKEIEEKAKQLYFEQAMMPVQLGVAMAEWMQESMVEKACGYVCELCKKSYANDCHDTSCELRTGLIDAMKGGSDDTNN